MKTMTLAGLGLGLLTTVALVSGAFAQADRLAIQSEPARNGSPGWHLGPSFPDPTGFTLVDADGTVHVIPREERRAMMGGAAQGAGGHAAIPSSAAARTVLRAVRSPASSGIRPWATNSPIPMWCPKASAACRRWPWIPRAIS